MAMQLLCVGDIALMDPQSAGWAWEPPGGLHPGDDARILFNWELPSGKTVNSVPRSSGPRLVAHVDSIRAIYKWAPGFATLATNHMLDAGEEGLTYTLESLARAGFYTVGAGRTREEIARPLFWETPEGKLAVINWVFPETHPEWQAVPGPNCWPGSERAAQTIAELKTLADWVLVVVHWSDELFCYPRPEDRDIAGDLARMGADLIIGHHPHVVRGMEVIGSCPVFYSLGNFYFSELQEVSGRWIVKEAPRNREALAVEIRFRRGQAPSYQALSFWRTKDQAVPDPLHRATRRMRATSRPLQRWRGPGYAAWYAAQRARFDRWGCLLQFGLCKLDRRNVMRILSRSLHSRHRGASC